MTLTCFSNSVRRLALAALLFSMAASAWAWNKTATHAGAAVSAGRDLFMAKCAVCHKNDGTGQSYLPAKANLHRPAVQKKTDAQLADFIKKGFPPMPAWNGVLSDAQIHSVVRFIRTFKTQAKR